MGYSTSFINGPSWRFCFAAIFWITLVFTTTGCIAGLYDTDKGDKSMDKVVQQIERFHAGETFRGDTTAFIAGGVVDYQAVDFLAEALLKEEEAVSEQIAALLAGIAKNVDPLNSMGGDVVRDARIIEVLIDYGLTNPGIVRDYCLDVLQLKVPPKLLVRHGKALSVNLEQWPDSTAFLLVAKVKPPVAVEIVDKLAETPEWGEEWEVHVAKAGLGNTDVEASFTDAFLASDDPEEKAALAEKLGFIGTETSLKAVASEMRTGLIIEMPEVMNTSVRLSLIEAFNYNFPENPIFFVNTIVDDSGYAMVETFCETNYGIEWTTKRPPFLTIQGFPSDLPMEE